tara:strand:- start:187 stop:459 length:273 start_codon:yes stop_codon:yes gene_type:complete
MKTVRLNLLFSIVFLFIIMYFILNRCLCCENFLSISKDLTDNNINFFNETDFAPDCCLKVQSYSTSTGCACISDEQIRFLSERAGNNIQY